MAAAWSLTTFSFRLGAGYANTFVSLDIPIDINGDGLPDLIVGRSANSAGITTLPNVPITIMLNEGHGHFKDATSSFFPHGAPGTVLPTQAVIADFNGDGRPDLFISDQGFDAGGNLGAQNHLFLSSGAHGFVDATNHLPQIVDISSSATAADITGNGFMDIFVSNSYDGLRPSTRPYFLMNDGTGLFTADYSRLPSTIENSTPFGYWSSLLFDANGDHHPDLFLGYHGAGPSVLLLNDGTGNFSTATPIDLPFPGGFVQNTGGRYDYITKSAAADLTGDGDQDLVTVWTDSFTGYEHLQILINDGHGNFTDETARRLPSSLLPQATISFQLVDVNGDGYPDIVPDRGRILLNDGTGHFIALPDAFPSLAQLAGVGVPDGFLKTAVDANHDGRMDLLFDTTNGTYYLFTQPHPARVQVSHTSHDVLFGGNGRDNISGLSGHDIIFGGRGNDNLRGGGGNNYLNGGTGNDTLDGGPGHNTLFGGPGADHFVFDSAVNRKNVATIVDFTPSQHDKIVLSEAHFHGIGAIGHLLAAAHFHIGAQASTHAQHIVYDPSNGFLYYDPDGSGRHPQVHFATVTANLDLHNTDFLVAA